MIKVLWFLVVFKNKKPSDLNSLLVGKGGFEPPAPALKPLLNKGKSNHTFIRGTVGGRSYFTVSNFFSLQKLELSM
jgi:hypothetical protein